MSLRVFRKKIARTSIGISYLKMMLIELKHEMELMNEIRTLRGWNEIQTAIFLSRIVQYRSFRQHMMEELTFARYGMESKFMESS